MAGECNSGDVDIMDTPREINIVDFMQSRALELDEMMKAVSQSVAGGSRSVMQLLPRHMRRRAANHDVRRLPLKQRLAAQTDNTDSAKLRKRPSRRHRRRPKNLLTEYACRKRRKVWLETHIWHAKRFHMTEMWGYKIPNYPNDRGVRAAYRDATTRCLIMDLSYYCCIEITGQQQHIVNSLAHITSPEIGPTFGAVFYISGTRQGRTVLYRENSYPFHALGDVTFLWRPLASASTLCDSTTGLQTRQLWIWTHPACYSDILTELMKAFHLTEADNRSLPVSSVCGSSETGEEAEKLLLGKRKKKKMHNASSPKRAKLRENSVVDVATKAKNTDKCSILSQDMTVSHSEAELSDKTAALPQAESIHDMNIEPGNKDISSSGKIKSQKSFQGGDPHLLSKTELMRIVYENDKVRLESLKDELCRFRLVGPKSHGVIVEALHLENQPSVTDADHTNEGQQICLWDHNIIAKHGSTEVVQQANSWKKISALQNAAELPPLSVHGLIVRDPRLFLPQHRTSPAYCVSGDSKYSAVNDVEAVLSSSPIWDRSVRGDVQRTKMSTAELNHHRSKCLLPGSVPELGCRESRIPVLLIQNPGFHSNRFTHQRGDGISTDFGSGWDIILPAGWSMAFWIALVYRGAKAAGLREQRSLAFEAGELTFPDCCPDTASGAEISSSRATALKSAYSRRPPAKRCNYSKMGVSSPFHCPWLELVEGWMLRYEMQKDHSLNDKLFYCVQDRKLLQMLNDICYGITFQSKSSRRSCVQGCTTASLSTALLQHSRAIVKVRVAVVGRGAPSQFAMICLPTKEDILNTANGRNHSGGVIGATEPVHRKSSVTECRNLNPSSALRPTIGFVVEGGFSHASGKGSGVGFVSALGLHQLLEKKPDPTNNTMVLVRCTQSSQYRPATLHIVL